MEPKEFYINFTIRNFWILQYGNNIVSVNDKTDKERKFHNDEKIT